MDILGHSENDGGNGVAEPLFQHLECVAHRAGEYASRFSSGRSAIAAGMLHDLGKFADQFQRRVRGVKEVGKDHWTAGALGALGAYGDVGVPIALCVEGHHTGLGTLYDTKEYKRTLARYWEDEADKFTESNLALLIERYKKISGAFPAVTEPFTLGRECADGMLDVRMLFSCLVDADFIETEAHFNGDAKTRRRYRPACPSFDFERALARIRKYVAGLSGKHEVSDELRSVRSRLFDNCTRAGRDEIPGLFTLIAPTGAGKTLAMLAFALEHAVAHGLTRIIVVMPFLNILDQTVSEYRTLFSKEEGFDPVCILEDHSLAESRNDAEDGVDAENAPLVSNRRLLRRLLSQNWDAPIILTTSVKILESLHANRPGACRKLHRLAKSVILFDEVQTLPPGLVVPTLATLAHLSNRYGSSVVFSTATQPAFDHLSDRVRRYSSCEWRPRSIVKDAPRMFSVAAKRVTIDWRLDSPVSLETLADELSSKSNGQVLCIVNVKRHAAQLAGLLQERRCEGVFHLSTSMCPLHREDVLKGIRENLDDTKEPPTRLIATQCVEAGVDLDFPVVYRAVGPLDSIAQAAGRCNRHDARPVRGQVRVFMPEDEKYPPKAYRMAAETTKVFLRSIRGRGGTASLANVLYDTETIRSYYRTFYDLTQAADANRYLLDALREQNFKKVAELYKLIDKEGINVLVPFDVEAYNSLRQEADDLHYASPRAVRSWMARVRPHTVTIHRPREEDAIWCYLDPISWGREKEKEPVWFVCRDQSDSENNPIYDRELLGLRTDIEFGGII